MEATELKASAAVDNCASKGSFSSSVSKHSHIGASVDVVGDSDNSSSRSQIVISNSKFKIQNYLDSFCLVFTTIAAMILIISSFSVTRGNNLCSSTITVVIHILNQYFVSLASFKAICNLLRKSALLCAD